MSHRATGGRWGWPDSKGLGDGAAVAEQGQWAGSVSGGQHWFQGSARV